MGAFWAEKLATLPIHLIAISTFAALTCGLWNERNTSIIRILLHQFDRHTVSVPDGYGQKYGRWAVSNK